MSSSHLFFGLPIVLLVLYFELSSGFHSAAFFNHLSLGDVAILNANFHFIFLCVLFQHRIGVREHHQELKQRTAATETQDKASKTRRYQVKFGKEACKGADDGDGWQKWNGNWWMRVEQMDLNSRLRSEISSCLRRMIIREQNGMAGLLRELRNGIEAEIEGTNRRPVSTFSEHDEPSRNDEVITNCTHERIQLVLQ